ncbi:MAG TPA: hypothetical protein VMM78_03505 [Thermomicrobiales bacterium]|nr:hypothetical protein [Thermomicrobiales bacterium]
MGAVEIGVAVESVDCADGAPDHSRKSLKLQPLAISSSAPTPSNVARSE